MTHAAMNHATREALHRINRSFYQESAVCFSETRREPWPGWRRVVRVASGRGLLGPDARVLDVGCGNGRFSGFLSDRGLRPAYLGIDSSAALLGVARKTAPDPPRARFVCADLSQTPPSSLLGRGEPLPDRFQLIVVFGLLHHIPGFESRQDLLVDLSRLLAPRGILAVSFWQFGAGERFRRRFVPWEAHNRRGAPLVDPSQLERGDVLLRWGEDAEPLRYRYCHFTDEREAERLLRPLPLEEISRFLDDGRGRDLNLYVLLERGRDTD